MIIATPSIQLATSSCGTSPQEPIALSSGDQPLTCPSGANLQVVTLPNATVAAALSFPLGVTTAVYVFISAITATDLIVNIGSGTPFAMSLPPRQGVILYNITSAEVSLSSVAGGQVEYSVGG